MSLSVDTTSEGNYTFPVKVLSRVYGW